LNTDISTEILTLKLKKKRANVIRLMNFFLAKVILPKVNKKLQKGSYTKSVDFSLLENKYKNFNISSIINKNNLDEILKGLYSSIISPNKNGDFYKKKNYIFSKVEDIVFNSIKHKNMGGIRLEVKGRLTKRYRADRAIFKVL
jgi:hypothetical protein